MSSTAPIQRPWEHIPNPFGFKALGEHAQQIHLKPPRHNASGGKSKAHQRSQSVGRDWLGRGFRVGDTLLATIAGSNAMVEVEEVFLDDGLGQPYTQPAYRGTLAIERTSGIIVLKDYRHAEPLPVDPEWISPGFGLVSLGPVSASKRYSQQLSDDFDLLQLQSSRIRCRPLDGRKRVSFYPEKLSVIGGDPIDEQLYRLYMENANVPLLDR